MNPAPGITSGITSGSTSGTPADAALLGLLTVPELGPARLRRLLQACTGAQAWAALVSHSRADLSEVRALTGAPGAIVESWRAHARATDLARLQARAEQLGVRTRSLADADFPPSIKADPEGAPVLVLRGPGSLSERGVAIVGTRRPTPTGRQIATRLGRELAEAGVCVISGLALGIDGAAHAGALAAQGAVVGVAGSGVDVVYPWANRHLWEAVSASGLLVSECALGATPHAGRFPSRNRIIAALARVVVVVESHARGGSLITARLAHQFDRQVLCVPGSVLSSASEGTNRFLRDTPSGLCLGVHDVLTALGWSTAGIEGTDPRRLPDPVESALLAALGWDPASLDALAARTGRSFGELLVTLMRLEADQWVGRDGGLWFQLAPPVAPAGGQR